MNKQVKTGIIGCGKVGHFHAAGYSISPLSEFFGVYDQDFERAKVFAANYGVRAFSSIEEMTAAGCEAVSICTPHPFHRDAAVKAAGAGMHIIIEKPLASSLSDCDAIIFSAEKSGVIGATVCQRRFYEPVKRIRAAIDEGKIGKSILGTIMMHGWRDMNYYAADPWRGTWKGEGGGVLVNQAPHQLDLLLWFMGDIDELYGAWDTLNHPELEVEDTAVAVIRFKNGGLGSIVVSNSQNPALYGRVHVHGENGGSVGVQTDGGSMFIAGMSSITEPPVLDLWTVHGEENKLNQYVKEDSDFFNGLDDFMYYYHRQQLEDFLQAILAGREPLVTLRAGRKTVELFTAIYRSNRDRKPVKFPLLPEDGDNCDGRLLKR
ncbi:MAG: Gfo/Idh/MocA family oxidoreductase [Clostridia bacterium]|nr:Gfo/Idh/MocA family oxidoreductase [Clostridia bacterium]